MKSKCMVGTWNVENDNSFFVKDQNTAYLSCDTHDGVVFKFTQGLPAQGDPVIVSKHLDTCVRPGTFRPSVRRMIRVRPAKPDGRQFFPIRLASGIPASGWNLDHGYTLYLDKPAAVMPVPAQFTAIPSAAHFLYGEEDDELAGVLPKYKANLVDD